MNRYYNEPYLKEIETKVVSAFEEEGKTLVQLETNIFHPQGGGQKGDRGVLIIDGREFLVADSIKDKESERGAVLLVLKDPLANPEEIVGKNALSKINWEFRLRQMRLHSCNHLHHCMLEKVSNGAKVPYPKTSDIQEGFAYNRYEGISLTAEMVDAASAEFKKIVEAGAETKRYPDPEKPNFWWWESMGYKIPCGGTHVQNLKEIGPIEISFSAKKGNSTVSFKLPQ